MNQHTSVQQKQQENQQKYERTQMQRENCDSAAERAGMQDHKAEDGAARHHTE